MGLKVLVQILILFNFGTKYHLFHNEKKSLIFCSDGYGLFIRAASYDLAA
jgi:hypothetical protein